MTLSYKLTEDKTGIQMNDKGMPIYIDENGKEQGIDALHLLKKVPSLQNDLTKKREEASSLKSISDTLEGLKFDISSVDNLKKEITSLQGISSLLKDSEISDIPEYIKKANAAFDKLQAFNEKDFKSTEEIEKIKKKATDKIAKDLTQKYNLEKEDYEKLLKDQYEKISKQDANIFKLMVADKFNTSKFVKDKLSRSPREAKLLFGNNFKVEVAETGDQMVYGFLDGEKINSLEKPGNYAGFEEALMIMVNSDPDKDSLLKGSGKSGTGGTSTQNLGGLEGLIADQKKALKDGDFVNSIRLKREISNLQNKA